MNHRRWLLCLSLSCTPAAGSVGAWTGEDPTTGNDGGDDDDDGGGPGSTTAIDPGRSSDTSSSGSPAASSESSGVPAADLPPIDPGPWIATVRATATPRLSVVTLGTLTTADVCEFPEAFDPDTLVFLPDGTLLGARGDAMQMWIVDPCTCAMTTIGPLEPVFEFHAVVEAGSADDPGLVGLDDERAALAAASTMPLEVTSVLDYESTDVLALARGPSEGTAYAIVELGLTNTLRTIDLATAATLAEIPLAASFVTPGLTHDPEGPDVIACDASGQIVRIDTERGSITELGTPWPEPCRALATPPGPIACIDRLVRP